MTFLDIESQPSARHPDPFCIDAEPIGRRLRRIAQEPSGRIGRGPSLSLRVARRSLLPRVRPLRWNPGHAEHPLTSSTPHNLGMLFTRAVTIRSRMTSADGGKVSSAVSTEPA
jgi:hypothetical protein